MSEFVEYERVCDEFDKRQYIHFVTLKPPRGSDKTVDVMRLMEYMNRRKMLYWLVECDSETEYKHYHGIISFSDDTCVEDILKRKASFQRKVNRDIGFCYPLQKVDSLKCIYQYIRGSTNKNIREWITIKEYL